MPACVGCASDRLVGEPSRPGPTTAMSSLASARSCSIRWGPGGGSTPSPTTRRASSSPVVTVTRAWLPLSSPKSSTWISGSRTEGSSISKVRVTGPDSPLALRAVADSVYKPGVRVSSDSSDPRPVISVIVPSLAKVAMSSMSALSSPAASILMTVGLTGHDGHTSTSTSGGGGSSRLRRNERLQHAVGMTNV